MTRRLSSWTVGQHLAAAAFQLVVALGPLRPALEQEGVPQETAKPSAAQKASSTEKAANPAQIELLETKVRFESNGDSQKEVHALVQINSELGVRQFARLNFDFNRSFESVEIPLVHITHASGGSADILPSAINDQPNPAVVNAPAYQDVRVKSVRILGLEPGDKLEYRVSKAVSHHPLAPDFWFDHTFDRTGVVSKEIIELELPSSSSAEVRTNTRTSAFSKSKSGDGGYTTYRWEQTNNTEKIEGQATRSDSEPDIALSTEGWRGLSIRLGERLTFAEKALPGMGTHEQSPAPPTTREVTPKLAAKAQELTKGVATNRARLEALYDFVSQKISTVDLPLGVTGFISRPASDVLESGYAIPEDKFVLFAALAAATNLHTEAALTGYCNKSGVARPSVFKHLLISANDGNTSYWLDPSLEVAPFGMVSSSLQNCVFLLSGSFPLTDSTAPEWQAFNRRLPFAAHQKVDVEASLAEDGKLDVKVHYALRGDNELLLRLAFHQTAKEKWKDIAQLLSITDGFRGQVSNVTASDPYATHKPFTLTYEIGMPKFVDWAKKSVRIPALLPQLGLPDPPGKSTSGGTAPINLGTPLEVETQMTLHLPPGTSATTPTGTAVERDYATYTSQYSATGTTVTASRHIRFLLREIPGTRALDYNAFLRAVQSDAAQDFTLQREASTPASPQP